MLIDITELEIGDEVLIGHQGDLRLIKILRKPNLSKRKNWKRQQMYTNVKAIVYTKTESFSYVSYGNTTRQFVKVVNDITKQHDAKEKNINLNFKQIYLIKREQI